MEEIYQYLTGLNDNGNAISLNVETGEKSLGATFEAIVNPVELILEVEEGRNIEVMVAFDGGAFHSKGVIHKGINRLPLDIDPATGEFPRCKEINIAFREISKSKVVFGRVAILYYETGDAEYEDNVEVFNQPTSRSYN